MLSNMKYDTMNENTNPDESFDIITTTLQPDETSIAIATSDENNEIAKNIVKLPSGSNLLLNKIQKRYRKKSKVIVKCFNCTINL